MDKPTALTRPRPVTERAAAWLREADPSAANPRAVALATAVSMWPVWQRLETRGALLPAPDEGGDLPRWRTHVAERFAWLALNAELFVSPSGPHAQPSEIEEHIERLNRALKRVKHEADWIVAHVCDGETAKQLAILTAFPRVLVPLRPMPERERPIIRSLSESMLALTGRPFDALVAAVASIVLGRDVDVKRVEKIRKMAKSDPENPEPNSPKNGEIRPRK